MLTLHNERVRRRMGEDFLLYPTGLVGDTEVVLDRGREVTRV